MEAFLDPVTNQSPKNKSTSIAKVSKEVYAALQILDNALRLEYGCDFAYTVMGHGYCLAASNHAQGLVTPVLR